MTAAAFRTWCLTKIDSQTCHCRLFSPIHSPIISKKRGGVSITPFTATRRRHTTVDIGRKAALTAVIDIGSNSVRLVVYQAQGRNPLSLFNEKVMCELGRSVGDGGALSDEAIARAIGALRRFAALCKDMGLSQVRTVATAAVRTASNRDEFLREVRVTTGLHVDIISGDEEARLSALGVISAIPEADGVMGDLGGGSVELVRVAAGKVFERASLQLGPFALAGLTAEMQEKRIAKQLADMDWLKLAQGKPFYMVGGAWRALCHLHMHVTHFALPMIHGYQIPVGDLDFLLETVQALNRAAIKAIPNLSERRVPTLPIAIMLLKGIAARMKATVFIASAHGLREGLLYDSLSETVQAEDPLIAACRDEAELEGRFPEHGDILMAWMDPLFVNNEFGDDRRLRHAACLLSDVAWRGHPDFRAQRAVDASLFGNFVGVDSHGRIMIALALNAAYGGENTPPMLQQLSQSLLTKADAKKALSWGLALRLGQRLTAGTARALEQSTMTLRGDAVVLTLSNAHAAHYGEVVDRRLNALADALKLKAKFRVA
jgi:exopolyphosphatase / guanosine-5'-triphosphate,3'-diphosphate pyrophosphatase